MALGPRDTTSLVMLTGWDSTELTKYALQDGTTFDRVVSEMNAALAAFNAELFGDPLWSSLVSYQDNPEVEYRVGASNGMEIFTEYGRPDAKRAATEGHMLPLLAFDRGLGWTWDYLRKARMSQIQADIADGIKDARDRFRVSILSRLLKRADDSGAAKGLGASGYSPGFATAASATAVDFIPPSYGGAAFDANHEHYVGISGGAFTAAVFTDAKQELLEHGHEPPYEFLIGASDEAAVKALCVAANGGAPAPAPLINYTTTEVANFGPQYGVGTYYIGTIADFRVRVVAGIPQYYGVGYKSYGPNSQRNPLRVRLQKGASRPQVIAMTDPRSGGNAAWPLQYMMLFMEFGVGVADRTAATPRYVNNTTWADGTPT